MINATQKKEKKIHGIKLRRRIYNVEGTRNQQIFVVDLKIMEKKLYWFSWFSLVILTFH